MYKAEDEESISNKCLPYSGLLWSVYLQPGKIKTGENMAEFPKTRHIIPVVNFPIIIENRRQCRNFGGIYYGR